MPERDARRARPAIIGEVLFDRFPDGTRVLGGAPFNVAWHLQGFGAAPLLVSRVGADDDGRIVRQAMSAWGMDQSALETDGHHPTGMVDIRFDAHTHHFDILPDQAYDHISAAPLETLARGDIALLYQGTLVMRRAPTGRLLHDFLASNALPLFVDINLREPWWRGEDFPWLLCRARWLKVNDEELDIIAKALDCEGNDPDESARRLQSKTEIALLIVTHGAKGAKAFRWGDDPISVAPRAASEVVDTVGAGDGFASVCLLGLLRDWAVVDILQRAQQFATRIVAQRGATRNDAGMYQDLLREWEQTA